jgi:1,4-alpha-glucan branching enzyme
MADGSSLRDCRTERAVDNRRVHIAEFWHRDRFKGVLPPSGGLGFDAVWHDGLRDIIRRIISEAAGGRDSHVHLEQLADRLRHGIFNVPFRWQAVEYLESHDVIDVEHNDRQLRIPKLAHFDNPHLWYGTSRSRVAAGLVLTAPGIPMLFMGQEFLEDKFWSDNENAHPGHLIHWPGLESTKPMKEYFQFIKELIWLRRRHPALRGESINVFYVHELDRIIAFHRWVEGFGRDVVVVSRFLTAMSMKTGSTLGPRATREASSQAA